MVELWISLLGHAAKKLVISLVVRERFENNSCSDHCPIVQIAAQIQEGQGKKGIVSTRTSKLKKITPS